MLKKIAVIMLVAGLIVPVAAWAKNYEAKNKVVGQNEVKNENPMYKLEKEKLTEIGNSTWDVTLTAFDKNRTKTEDKLIFQNGTVKLSTFEKIGFPAIGYTVTPDPDGKTASWENYFEHEKGILAFKGTWVGGEMEGGVTWIELKGKDKVAHQYAFTSRRVDESADEMKAVEKTEPVAEVAPVSKLVSQEKAKA